MTIRDAASVFGQGAMWRKGKGERDMDAGDSSFSGAIQAAWIPAEAEIHGHRPVTSARRRAGEPESGPIDARLGGGGHSSDCVAKEVT